MKLTLLFFLSLFPIICTADLLGYVCTIKQELSVTSDGDFKPHKKPIEIGSTFGVDRKTGKIIGRPFTNATAKEIRIITQGNSSRNFEVLSASSPTGKATTDLVIIHEWEKNYEKTFTALSNDTAYSGICI